MWGVYLYMLVTYRAMNMQFQAFIAFAAGVQPLQQDGKRQTAPTYPGVTIM